MTDLEKLMRLIDEVADITPVSHAGQISYYLDSKKIADHLLAHGVTVKEPQKPIAETNLGKYLDSPVWFEEFGRDVAYLPLLLDGIGIYYAEFKEFGKSEWLDRRIDDYNYQWRCWAEKPTEEERRAAEWES